MWKYGMLEIVFNGVWSILREGAFTGDALGRRGAQVACRSLGFDTGAQLLVGASSPFVAPMSTPDFIDRITCVGSEDGLAMCDIVVMAVESDFATGQQAYDYGANVVTDAVTLICTTPSGV